MLRFLDNRNPQLSWAEQSMDRVQTYCSIIVPVVFAPDLPIQRGAVYRINQRVYFI